MSADIISRIRRNHGLEHATIHVLSQKFKNFSAQGHSNHTGFFLNIYGEVPESAVQDAVVEAHQRMKGGEHQLAVHPNCGTVLMTTGLMAAVAAQLVFGVEQMRQRRSALNPLVFFDALPSAVLAVVVTLIVSRPIGMAIQEKFTTEGDLGALRVVQVKQISPSVVTQFFRVLLAGGRPLKTRAYRIFTEG
ncbi:MAG: hypothetical protein KDE09_19745 [Anaerolineales bacterium]|nr:hypothetical protein [Anaerolineales bacterium]